MSSFGRLTINFMTNEEKRLEIASRNLAGILGNDYWLSWLHKDAEAAIGPNAADEVFRSQWMAKRAAIMAMLHADALLVEADRPTQYVEPLAEVPPEAGSES